MVRVFTEEHKRNISIKTKEAMQRPEIRRKVEKTQYKKGNIPWTTGRGHPPEVRLKISQNTKIAMQRPKIKERVEKTQFKKGIIPWNKGKTNVYTKDVIEKIRNARLKQIFPPRDTNIEVMMQDELRKRGIKFEKHSVVLARFQPDLIFAKEKLIVFCDGDYWHANPDWLVKNNREINEVQEKNIKRDKIQNELLIKNGWKYLRFWEVDIKTNVQLCVDKIEEVLKSD